MRKLIILVITAFIGSLPVMGQKYSGDSWAEVRKNGSGELVCIYYETPGLVYKDSDGKMKGVCVDLLGDFSAYIKTKYGKELKITFAGQEQAFTDFMKHVASSPNIIGVANVSITEERKKIMSFSPPYMSNPMVLLTGKKAPTLSNLSEIATKFKGYSARTITGSTHVNYIKSIKENYFPDLTITYTTAGRIILRELASDDKIFTVLDFTEYFDAVKNKVPVKRHNVNLGDAEELGFVMDRRCDWKPLWDEFLTEDYRNSIQYRKIIAANLGNAFLTLIKS